MNVEPNGHIFSSLFPRPGTGQATAAGMWSFWCYGMVCYGGVLCLVAVSTLTTLIITSHHYGNIQPSFSPPPPSLLPSPPFPSLPSSLLLPPLPSSCGANFSHTHHITVATPIKVPWCVMCPFSLPPPHANLSDGEPATLATGRCHGDGKSWPLLLWQCQHPHIQWYLPG